MSPRRPLIMGILNVTPNSFSDGGKFFHAATAIDHARELIADGADLIDIGGESTRPGSARVDPDTEWERIAPVLEQCVAAGMDISVDTLHASTAKRALQAGVHYINDVSGGLADPEIYRVVADHPAARYILGHWRGTPETMNELATYDDVLTDVARELADLIAAARSAGVRDEQLIVDPGIGFAKNPDHNWRLLAHIERIRDLGLPVMIGVSRKRFLAEFTERPSEVATDRDLATAVLTALLAERDLWAVRVHHPAASRVALDIVDQLKHARHV